MHSNIYQISSSPISEENYRNPDTYCDNSCDFADYIGEVYVGKEREDKISGFADIVQDVFCMVEPGVFAYKGKTAMRKFKQQWLEELQRKTASLTTGNMFSGLNLFCVAQLTERTHLDVSSRVDISEWTGEVACPLGELFEWADSQLKKGDRFYIGAVIDYHY